MAIKPWEIWWACFSYEDSPEKKRRPVLVINPQTVYVLSCKITSHGARNQYGEYELIHWQSAGLNRPSTVRLTQMQQLEYSDFLKKIGDLHPEDRRYIEMKI